MKYQSVRTKIGSGMESSRPSLDFLLEMSEPESRSGSPAGSGSGGELHRLGRGEPDAAAVADDDDDGDGDDSQKEGSKDSGEGSDEQQSDGQRTASKSKKVREQNFIKSPKTLGNTEARKTRHWQGINFATIPLEWNFVFGSRIIIRSTIVGCV